MRKEPESKSKQVARTAQDSAFTHDLAWAEFKLKKLVTYCVLSLTIIIVFFVLGAIGIMIWRDIDVSPVIICTLITATIGGFGQTLYSLIKPYLNQRK
jgi:uncharacterized membrane protein YhaH (DUF805 family)